MVKIESIKDFINQDSAVELNAIAKKVYLTTSVIDDDYPKHEEWYFTKQLPESINSPKRNILFVRNPDDLSEIIAVSCLKKTNEEKKLCIIFVADGYRNLGIGSMILKESMQWLGTTKPLITIADYKLEMFKPFINKYGWELNEIINGLYNTEHQELFFNGSLKQELHGKLVRLLRHRYNELSDKTKI